MAVDTLIEDGGAAAVRHVVDAERCIGAVSTVSSEVSTNSDGRQRIATNGHYGSPEMPREGVRPT